MGLDMYLRAERYVWWNEDDLKNELGKHFPELPEGTSVKSVEAEVGYWRKANAVHDWFVKNVQGGKDECQKSFVSRDDIKALKTLCERVVANPGSAESLLPTASGFFFGSTEYDTYYLEDVKSTIEICDRALALPDQWDLYYQSSW